EGAASARRNDRRGEGRRQAGRCRQGPAVLCGCRRARRERRPGQAGNRRGAGIRRKEIARRATRRQARPSAVLDAGYSQRLVAHRLACQTAMAMAADTAAVTSGSAHCGGKCDGCAKTSPMKVAIALIVACRATLSTVRSICASRPTATAAPTIPQLDARSAGSKLNAARTLPRAITRKQASQAPANFSAAGRARPLVRRSPNASRTLNLRLAIDRPFLLHRAALTAACDAPPRKTMKTASQGVNSG